MKEIKEKYIYISWCQSPNICAPPWVAMIEHKEEGYQPIQNEYNWTGIHNQRPNHYVPISYCGQISCWQKIQIQDNSYCLGFLQWNTFRLDKVNCSKLWGVLWTVDTSCCMMHPPEDLNDNLCSQINLDFAPTAREQLNKDEQACFLLFCSPTMLSDLLKMQNWSVGQLPSYHLEN